MAISYEITGQFVYLPDNPQDTGYEYTDAVWSGESFPTALDVELARINALNGAAKIDDMEDVHFAQRVLPVEDRLGIRPELTIHRSRTILGIKKTHAVGTVMATSFSEPADTLN